MRRAAWLSPARPLARAGPDSPSLEEESARRGQRRTLPARRLTSSSARLRTDSMLFSAVLRTCLIARVTSSPAPRPELFVLRWLRLRVLAAFFAASLH